MQVTCLAYRTAVTHQPLLVSAGDDTLLKLWSTESATHPRTNTSEGSGAEADWNGQAEQALRAMRRGRWICAGVLRGHTGRILSLGISGGNGRLLVSSDSNCEVLLWADGGIERRSPSRTGPGGRDVQFVLMSRLQETWPVRCVAVGMRGAVLDHQLLLRDVVPSAWPEMGVNDDEALPLPQQLEAMERSLRLVTEEARQIEDATRVIKRLEMAAHAREPALSDRALLRQWVRGLNLDEDVTPLFKELDARRVQSLHALRELLLLPSVHVKLAPAEQRDYRTDLEKRTERDRDKHRSGTAPQKSVGLTETEMPYHQRGDTTHRSPAEVTAKLVTSSGPTAQQRAEAAFKALDADRVGTIHREEMLDALREVGVVLTMPQLDSLLFSVLKMPAPLPPSRPMVEKTSTDELTRTVAQEKREKQADRVDYNKFLTKICEKSEQNTLLTKLVKTLSQCQDISPSNLLDTEAFETEEDKETRRRAQAIVRKRIDTAIDAAIHKFVVALDQLNADHLRYGTEAEDAADTVVGIVDPADLSKKADVVMGDAPGQIVLEWRMTWRELMVPILASAAAAETELLQLDAAGEGLRSPGVQSIVKRLRRMVVPGVVNKAEAGAKKAKHLGAGQRMAMVIQAALDGYQNVLSQVLKLCEADVAEQQHLVEYVRMVASAGSCVVATSCDDLPLAPGMRLRLRGGGLNGEGRLGRLEKPIVSGFGRAQVQTGWVVMLESQDGDDERNQVVTRCEVTLQDLPSQKGVKIWSHLPLQEHQAIASHRLPKPKIGSEAAGGVEDVEAIKRLLDYGVGDAFLLQGAGYTVGWRLASRVTRQMPNTDASLHVGNVKEMDMEVRELATDTQHAWIVTHSLELLQEAQSLAFVGETAMFLAVGISSVMHLFIRSPLGALTAAGDQGEGGKLNLVELHSRTRANAVESVMESKGIDTMVVRQGLWEAVERIKLRIPVTALATGGGAGNAVSGGTGLGVCDGGPAGAAVVAVASRSVGLVKLVEVSRWVAAVWARQVLEAWLEAVVHRRWSLLLRDLVLEEEKTQEYDDWALLFDRAALQAKIKELKEAQQGHATTQDELKARAQKLLAEQGSDSAQAAQAHIDSVGELVDEVGQALQVTEERLRAHKAAIKDMVALGRETIAQREPYAIFSKGVVRRLLTKVLKVLQRERSETDRQGGTGASLGAGSGAEEAAVQADDALVVAKEGSLLGTDKMPLDEQVKALRLVFDLLDSDGSGEIDERELRAHCSKLGCHECALSPVLFLGLCLWLGVLYHFGCLRARECASINQSQLRVS